MISKLFKITVNSHLVSEATSPAETTKKCVETANEIADTWSGP